MGIQQYVVKTLNIEGKQMKISYYGTTNRYSLCHIIYKWSILSFM